MIAEALRLLRVYHRFSQSELSTDLHISKSYLCEIEAGKKKVSLEILNQYSKKFEVPVSSLLFFAESLEPGSKTSKISGTIAMSSLRLLSSIASGGKTEEQ